MNTTIIIAKMVKKDSRFIPTNIPNYLIKDIDDFMIRRKIKGSRASFIVGVLNDYLDEQIYQLEENQNRELKAKKQKEKPESLRAERHRLLQLIHSENFDKQMLEDYKELSKKIEKE